MRYDVIFDITTTCNRNCSYCNVVKDNRRASDAVIGEVADFLIENHESIGVLKFFGGEPLLEFKNIKRIIDKVSCSFRHDYEIVTNTSMLDDEIGQYFKKHFKTIFFSIDDENGFDYDKVFRFIDDFDLRDKICFNLIISPGSALRGLDQFRRLYGHGFKRFNILPVYFTKAWDKGQLYDLSSIMKNILDTSLSDKSLILHGFQKKPGDDHKLTNNSIFIDSDGEIYSSDIVNTSDGKKMKERLHLGNIASLDLASLNEHKEAHDSSIEEFQKMIYSKVRGQKELNDIMDYFSRYLNASKK